MALSTPLRLGIMAVSTIVVIAVGIIIYTLSNLTPAGTTTPSLTDDTATTPTNNTTTTTNLSSLPPTIYVSIVTHNEDTDGAYAYNYATDEADFSAQRDQVAKFAAMLKSHHVKYDFQTDWNFLLGMQAYDHGNALTNNKNLLRYLTEDLGMTVGPHSHEHDGYNYADVAYLISTFGVTPANISGGAIVSPVSESILGEFQQPMKGEMYPQYTWTPVATWGGGTHGHADDTSVDASGIWRPASIDDYLTPSATGLLPNIGHYNGDWSGLDDLLAKQKAGTLSNGQMYTTTIFTGQNLLTDDYISAFEAMLNKYDADTQAGHIVWSNLADTLSTWQTTYQSTPTVLRLTSELTQSPLSAGNATTAKEINSPITSKSKTPSTSTSSTTTTTTTSSGCGDGVCVAPENTFNCAADCRTKK